MFKKISVIVLSLCIALAVTLGVGAHVAAASQEAEITMCDMPFARISFKS